jgi:hypothetical protein
VRKVDEFKIGSQFLSRASEVDDLVDVPEATWSTSAPQCSREVRQDVVPLDSALDVITLPSSIKT